jgi:hypothetical protein
VWVPDLFGKWPNRKKVHAHANIGISSRLEARAVRRCAKQEFAPGLIKEQAKVGQLAKQMPAIMLLKRAKAVWVTASSLLEVEHEYRMF